MSIIVLGYEIDTDPADLRAIADLADVLTEALAGLDPALLSELTLSRSPGFIAGRLRGLASLIERKQRGEPGFSDVFEIIPPEDRQRIFREMDVNARHRAAREMGLLP